MEGLSAQLEQGSGQMNRCCGQWLLKKTCWSIYNEFQTVSRLMSRTIYNLREIMSTAKFVGSPPFSISGGLAGQPFTVVTVKISSHKTDAGFGFGD